MSVDVGSRAPDFTLVSQDREPVTLSAQAGRKVVLAFFPAAFTGVCTKEMCQFRDSLAQLDAANAVVYGVSVDHPASLKEFARQQQLNFTLLSDFNKEAIAKYDVVNPDMGGLKGVARRAVFVIDAEGVIRYREVTPTPGDEPDYRAVMAIVERV
jgi:glutaredoxin-dependent peroxiredoxin